MKQAAFYIRATIVAERAAQLAREAKQDDCSPERREAIKAEMDACLRGIEDIREEQLISMLPKPKRPKRRWWRRKTDEDSA